MFDYWEQAYHTVAGNEAGISTDKADRGNYALSPKGRVFINTRYGLTFNTWLSQTGIKKVNSQEDFAILKNQFEQLNPMDVKNHFKKYFWDKNKLNLINDPKTATNILDAAINQNWTIDQSNRNNINKALGIKDAKDVNDTIKQINEAIRTKGSLFVNDSIGMQRAKNYAVSKTAPAHLTGWFNRLKTFVSNEAKTSIDDLRKSYNADLLKKTPIIPSQSPLKTTFENSIFNVNRNNVNFNLKPLYNPDIKNLENNGMQLNNNNGFNSSFIERQPTRMPERQPSEKISPLISPKTAPIEILKGQPESRQILSNINKY